MKDAASKWNQPTKLQLYSAVEIHYLYYNTYNAYIITVYVMYYISKLLPLIRYQHATFKEHKTPLRLLMYLSVWLFAGHNAWNAANVTLGTGIGLA